MLRSKLRLLLADALGVVADTRRVGGEAALVFDQLAAGEQETQYLLARHVGCGARAEAGLGTVAAGKLGFEFRTRGRRGGFVNEAEDFVAVNVFNGICIHDGSMRYGRSQIKTNMSTLYDFSLSLPCCDSRSTGNVLSVTL